MRYVGRRQGIASDNWPDITIGADRQKGVNGELFLVRAERLPTSNDRSRGYRFLPRS